MMLTNIQPDTRSGLALLRMLLLIVAVALSFMVTLQIQKTRKRIESQSKSLESLAAALSETNIAVPPTNTIIPAEQRLMPVQQAVPIKLVPLGDPREKQAAPPAPVARQPSTGTRSPVHAARPARLSVGQAQVVYYQPGTLTFIALPLEMQNTNTNRTTNIQTVLLPERRGR
jgi:hypothetical protein